MKNKISVDEAVRLLCDVPVNIKKQDVSLFGAQGRVLAEDIMAVMDVPAFDRSPYDGYAFRGEDTAGATADNPAVLRITQELVAGSAPGMRVTAGTCAKILTGAPVPEGANAIVKYEVTEFTDEYVRIFSPVRPDTDIIRAGEDVQQGELLARKGDVVTPALAGVLAGQGLAQVSVFQRPRAFVMCTGSELVSPGQPLPPGKIYNSNIYTISAYLDQMGIDCTDGGSAPDDAQLIAQRISSAMDDHDIVVTTGGASVGDYDFALRSSQLMGANVLFWKLDMKPGGSVVVSEKDGKLIINLSGNPGAAALTLLRVISVYVRRLCGRRDVLPESMTLVMLESFGKKSPQLRLIRGRMLIEDGTAYFLHSGSQGNGSVSSLVGCDVLAEIPAGSPPVEAGARVRAYRV